MRFPPGLVLVFETFIDMVLKLSHDSWNRNLILTIVDPPKCQSWRIWLIYHEILISLPCDHDIWHPKLIWINRKVPMEECQITTFNASSPNYTYFIVKQLLWLLFSQYWWNKITHCGSRRVVMPIILAKFI